MTHNATDSAKRWIRLLLPAKSITDPLAMADLHGTLPYDVRLIEWEKQGDTLDMTLESIEFMEIFPGSALPEMTR
jgi:hypothetical protein